MEENRIPEFIKIFTTHYKKMWRLVTNDEEGFYMENQKGEGCEMFMDLSAKKKDLIWEEIQRTVNILSVLIKLI